MKQVLVVRADLVMSRGKLAAQAAHAAVSALDKASAANVRTWKRAGQKKVVVKAADLKELLALRDRCAKLKLPHALISDAGMTELAAGEITALGIGPDDEKRIDAVTGALALLR